MHSQLLHTDKRLVISVVGIDDNDVDDDRLLLWIGATTKVAQGGKSEMKFCLFCVFRYLADLLFSTVLLYSSNLFGEHVFECFVCFLLFMSLLRY
jgi:hypothetical protein